MPPKIKQSFLVVLSAFVIAVPSARGQLFESDSKRLGTSKMDIVVREIQRRPRASVVEIKINTVGSSVGSSFFILCSIRQLAQLRGDYRYVIKLEDHPEGNHMLVGFLRNPDEPFANAGKEFERLSSREAVIDLEQFAQLCGFMK